MYRTLALAAALATLAVPAFARDITIDLAGKSKVQIQNEIHGAATTVCREQGFMILEEQRTCAMEAEQQALSDLAAMHHK
jgi:hypothetical protein